MMHHETGCEASAKHPDLFVALRGLAEKSLQVLCLFFALFGRTLATRIYLGSAGLLRHGEKMITLRAIKGTAPSECRYHRYGETSQSAFVLAVVTSAATADVAKATPSASAKG